MVEIVVSIVAVSDIHSPIYLSLFVEALARYRGDPDLVLLAGDLVDGNRIDMLQPVHDRLLDRFRGKPIIAVFGNEEYRGYEEEYRRRYPGIRWLDDEYLVISIGDHRVGVVGTRGALDKPTTWQSRNMPWLEHYYRELPDKMAKLVEEARGEGADIVVLLTHYGVTYQTVYGEPRWVWPYLASRRMGEVLKGRVDLIIHGHAHNAKRLKASINNTQVYNVALPANKSLVEIRIEPVGERGILKWLRG